MHQQTAVPIDYAELPFLIGDAHPNLRRLLHIHIPKTGGTSFDSLLCSTGETLPVPLWPELLLTIIPGLMGEGLGDDKSPASIIANYLKSKDRLMSTGRLQWLLPVGHIRLLEAISLSRDRRDVCFTLLRHPQAQVLSMLRFRIMETVHTTNFAETPPLHQFLGITHAEFTGRSVASDPELFRAILRLESVQERHLGLTPWFCLPGQANSCEQMLASIATHGIHCTRAATMAGMARSLTGLELDTSSASMRHNRTDDLNPSGLRLHIEEDVIAPFVEESSVELFHRLQEAGALEVWGDPGPAAVDDYWRCIDRALKAQAASSDAPRPLRKETDPLPLPPSLARLRLLQDLTDKSVALGQRERERDEILGSHIWRGTAPYRRFRHRLARLRRRLSRRES